MENDSYKNVTHHNLSKRDGTDQDPDYNEAAPPDRKRLRHLEENARSHLGERVKHILNNHFELEVNRQQNEILEIDKCISRVQQKLQILRYVATRSFFSSKILLNNGMPTTSQANIHPAVKCLLGKAPIKMSQDSPGVSTLVEEVPSSSSVCASESVKIPRYIPPKLPERVVAAAPVRGELHYLKKKLIIGNVSRWIPVSERDDTASHKWMVYVRGPKEEPNVSSFVSQVVFFLHPSYAPHDIVHVVSHPFHVTRRGWGEFPLRIQVHFHNPLCKPVNIIHNLKLDRSYSGLQTLGAETIVDVLVYDDKIANSSASITDETTSKVLNNAEQCQSKLDEGYSVKTEINGQDAAQSSYCAESPDAIRHIEHDNSMPSHAVSYQSDPLNHLFDNVNIKEEKMEVDDCSTEGAGILDCSGLPVEASSKISEENHIQNCEFNNIDSDHDYFSPKNVLESNNIHREENSAVLQKSDNAVEQFRGAFSAVSCSSTPANTFPTTAETSTKPVLVRCFNKNGTVFKLPLALLRNAVILQPYRITKPGESLLRPLLRTPTTIEQELPVVPSKSLGKVITSVAKCVQPAKMDSVRQDKLGVEARFAHERQNLDLFLERICSSRWNSVRDCVRILARSLSLVDARAKDPVYRSARPFTTSSLETFNSWGIGKRRSAEWARAKLVRQTLEKCSFESGENIWSTKVIMTWCRRQGYSPMCCWSQALTNPQPFASPALLSKELTTLTKAHLQSPDLIAEEDVSIEIETLSERVDKPSPIAQFPSVLLNDPESDLTSYITDSIERHGFKLGTELHDDCFISFARILLSRIWKGLAEDLLRRSLRESWLRTRGEKPDEISWIDSYRAITRRPQFDILTNAGLGMDDQGYDDQKSTTSVTL